MPARTYSSLHRVGDERGWNAVAEPALKHIGALGLSELAAICRQQGRSGLPFPLFEPYRADQGHAPSGHRGGDHARNDAADSGVFWRWAQAWTSADIWVEARVAHTDPNTDDIRVLGYRSGDRGYLGVQRRDEPAVDAYLLSAYDLAAAVANHLGLTTPGARRAITVPGYAGRIPGSNTALPSHNHPGSDRDAQEPPAYSTGPLLRAVRSTPATVTVVADTDVHAAGVVQSHCTPSRCAWGPDWTAPLATWVTIRDDGDYLYDPDHRHALPAGIDDLTARITSLIAADVTALRHQRERD